jgi:hypothetical protein
MKMIKLTAFTSLLFVLAIGMSSCEKNAEKKKVTDYSKNDIPMTGAQETPAVPSTALGFMDVFYSKETRMLSYTVRWSGLTDSVSLAHIHGLAPTGFPAPVVQTIVGTSNSIFPQKTAGKFTFAKSGSFSGVLLADGVAVKEQDIINGVYYLNIHTATYPAGEIRGQIRFQ